MTRSPPPRRRRLAQLTANSSWLLAGSGVRLVVGIGTSVWIARYLGPSSFGVYSYVISLVAIFGGVSVLGMQALVTRDLVEEPESRHEILGSALSIRAAGALVATLSLFALAFIIHAEVDYRIGIIVFSTVLLVQPLGVIERLYESRTDSRYIVAVKAAAAATFVLLTLLFIALGLSVVWFLLARLVDALVVQLGSFAVCAYHGYEPLRWRPSRVRMQGMLGQAWPLILSAFGATLYLRIDQVMLGQLTTAAEVGIYAAATRLSEAWYVIPGIAMSSVFPYLVELRGKSASTYAKRQQQMYDVLAWSGIAISITVTIFAVLIVAVLYGFEYSASASILRIHIWATVFIFMRAAFSKWLIAERLLAFSLSTQGSGALINIAMNAVLIPKYGGVGAAWSTVVSYAVASYFSLFIFRKTRPAALMMTGTLSAPVRLWRARFTGASGGK